VRSFLNKWRKKTAENWVTTVYLKMAIKTEMVAVS